MLVGSSERFGIACGIDCDGGPGDALDIANERLKPRGEFLGVGDPDRLTLSSSFAWWFMLPSYSAMRERVEF